jgi:hypothetical protein
VLERIKIVEADYPSWTQKIPRAVWRGTERFNPIWNTELRPTLIRLGKNKPWSDIEPLLQGDRTTENNNIIQIDEFCRWRYVIYTEGITYSGRLSYHQACTSVLITPPLHFLTHNSHLIKPLYASKHLASQNHKWEAHPAYPTSYPPEEANTVFVRHDWNDLEDTISWLNSNPRIGERIAQNQRSLMVDAGYLSQAADACYWRALIRAWSEKARITPGHEDYWSKGTRWETWVVGSTHA